MTDLDIIIPVFNEGENIIAVLEALHRSVKTSFRVLICYDHDNDDTLEALRRYQGAPLEIVWVKNRGRGVHGAVVTGFGASKAKCALVLPADDTYNANIIDLMFYKFEQGCDIVAGSRFVKGGRMEGCPWLKFILVRVSSFTLYHLTRLPIHDASNGFRLFSRRVIDHVEIESSQGFAYSIELLVKCHRLGWKICEVPALWFERSKGKSRFRLFRWLPSYLRWYFYPFATTYLGRGASTVQMKKRCLNDYQESGIR